MLRLAMCATLACAFGPARSPLAAPLARRPGGASRKAAPTMLFLTEAKLLPDALQWAKETSRTQRGPKRCVVALYDDAGQCAFVGAFADTAVAVASLCKKHGRASVSALRAEEFFLEAGEAEGAMLMDGLVQSWIVEATEDNGGAPPVGNGDAEWPDFDETQNPFLAGYIGPDGEGLASLLTEEEKAEEKLQSRRDNMKQNLDDAVARGDEDMATKLLRRITRLDDGDDDGDDDDGGGGGGDTLL